jgi:hypothetical protein
MPRFSGMRLAIQFPPPGDVTAPVFLTGTTGNNTEGNVLSFTITTDEKTTKVITGGVDAAQFEIVSGGTSAFSHTLRWVGNGTQSFGSPADADLNNTYVVQITATDESGNNNAQQTITITVTDVSLGEPIGLLLVLTKAS